MRLARSRFGFPGSSLASAAGVSPVEASSAQKKEATEHFVAGKQALTSRNWERAIAELRASLDVVDSPNARLELARAIRDSGDFGEAWSEYGRAIERATTLSTRESRYEKTAEAGTAERAEVERQVALVAVTLTHAPPNATLKVAGAVVPQPEWGMPSVVQAGEVDVILTNGGGDEVTRRAVYAKVGAKTEVVLDADVPVSPKPPPAAPASDPREDSPDARPTNPEAVEKPAYAPAATGSGWRPLAYVVGGAGVAGFATFAVFGLMSTAAYDDLKSACSRTCPPDRHDEIARGRTEQIVANVALGVGLAGVAGGTTLFLLGARSRPPGAARLVIAPGYVGVRGSL